MMAKPMSEASILHRVMIAMSNVGSRLFRNHVGMAYQGKAVRFAETQRIEVHPGDVLIKQARVVTAGIGTGTSDLIGWTSREITEYDLGKIIAQFTACEVKAEDGELQPEQLQFLTVVQESGGVAIVARSAEQAVERLQCGGPLK